MQGMSRVLSGLGVWWNSRDRAE